MPRRIARRRLAEMVAEATEDAQDPSEQVLGLFSVLEDELALPFSTVVLEAAVEVAAIELTDDDVIVAVCRRGRARQRIGLLDLPLPQPPPAGWQWIAAYGHWARSGR